MLISLHIENIAVIRTVDMDFSDGFTVMTGETGAGKSIIIDAVGLLLGHKADRELIRSGESSAMVSGLFGSFSDAALSILSAAGVYPDDDGNILIQRTLGVGGPSSVKLNGRSISIAVLRMIAPQLITVHGQSDTNCLTDASSQLSMLDLYAGNGALLGEYGEAYADYDAICREIQSISEREHERERLTEILRYQLRDIDQANLKEGEEEELVERKLKIKNSERILKNLNFVYRALKGSEKGSACYLLDRSSQALTQLSDVLPELASHAEKLTDCLYLLDDIAEQVFDVMEDGEQDPEGALNEIEARLDLISRLKRKYGLTVADILAFRERTAKELDTLENAAQTLCELEKRRESSYERALGLALRLQEKRTLAAREMESAVREILEFLDMPKVVFHIALREEYKNGKRVLSRSGADSVDFLISANRGAPAQPLARIASGGELARIMLALKSVIADREGSATLIFDEIDAGVSGKTARKIGIRMLALARHAQVFCVTHSAQIASLADRHFLVAKSDVAGKTETSVQELDYYGRVSELSRILGGIHVTESQRNAAVDMLAERENYKKES